MKINFKTVCCADSFLVYELMYLVARRDQVVIIPTSAQVTKIVFDLCLYLEVICMSYKAAVCVGNTRNPK